MHCDDTYTHAHAHTHTNAISNFKPVMELTSSGGLDARVCVCVCFSDEKYALLPRHRAKYYFPLTVSRVENPCR